MTQPIAEIQHVDQTTTRAPRRVTPHIPRVPRNTITEIGLEEIEVWTKYKETGDLHCREVLLNHYYYLVEKTASRIHAGLPSTVELGDLIGTGSVGLIDAVEKFELSRNIQFPTYAATRIRGEILDQLRNNDWVPRSVRTKLKKVEEATRELGKDNSRTPTDQEIQDYLGITNQEMQNIKTFASRTHLAPLDDLINHRSEASSAEFYLSDTLPDIHVPPPDHNIENEDIKRVIKNAVSHLDDRSKTVIALYYFENLTLHEIGRALGVTESRVCQLHNRALAKLKNHIPEVDPY